jgi:hypothetical protein
MSPDAAFVQRAVDEVRTRWRRLSALTVWTRAAAGLTVIWLIGWVAAASGGADGLRAALSFGAALVASAVWIAWSIWRRHTVPAPRELARYIEEQCPELEDRLATAVDVSVRPSDDGGPLREAMLADAARALRGVPLGDVVPGARVRRAGLTAAGASLVLAAVAILWIGPGYRAIRAAGLYALPGRLVLEVTPGHARVKRGDPLVIRARTTAADSGLVPSLTVVMGDEQRTVRMTRGADGGFAWRFDAVTASFAYRVAVAGRSSEPYRVTALDAPRVERIDLQYEFPPYTKLPPRTERDGGDIYAPSGTRVTVSVHASKPIAEGALALAGGKPLPLQRRGDNQLEASLAVTSDGAYRVALTDRDGLASSGETEYFIRVLEDRPPDVRILRPAGDRQVSPLEEVLIEARADDDYGVASFELVYSVRGAGDKVVPLGGERGALSVTSRHTLYLEDLGVKPGDFVTYHARVRDVGRGRRSTEARSDIFFLEVTPFEEEFAAAQSQAGAGGGGGGLDDLVTAQKDIIVATWKLERRATAGRSAQDIKAVARAQGELKSRTERAAGQARLPRRRPRVLQPGSAGRDEDPMSAAVSAMGRAQASLETMKTAQAIPAEMEALNHLLRAQAEIRRREVMRQQASGGGSGSNRSQQDLSALFDRELRRQQQTNYETPRNTEESPNDSRETSLDRVKELARRQEQLARQQQDLASDREKLSEEELKRRLERLTREQSELRQQAEQLARQLAAEQDRQARQQGQQPGQRGQQQGQRGQEQGQQTGQQASGQAAGGAQQLREASEEMKGAASDLRRDDPRQASERSARALDRLRSLERQLQGEQPDERRRALGDLQLEARQLADRQRGLAEQARAASAAGSATAADDRRRLAGEQEGLADRAGRLERQVQDLERAAAGDARARSAMSDAARAMAEGRVEERMRSAADALRRQPDGSGPGRDASPGEPADELARTLDRVADRLADASGEHDQEGRQLAEQLARAREARERLSDLRRQIERLQNEPDEDTQRRGTSAGEEGRQQAGSRDGGRQAGAPGGGERQRELQRLGEQYADQMREAARIQEQAGSQNRGGGASTPEGQAMSLSAPGTEAFKQDFSRWEILHKDVTLGLERLEASLSQALLERAARNRLTAGAADRAPDDYQRAVDAYFKSLAERP